MSKKINRSREHIISFRVNEKEKELLERKISRTKLNRREFFLALAEKKEIRSAEEEMKLIEINYELKKIGTNINQMARKINSDENLEYVYFLKMEEEFNKLCQFLNQ